MEWRLTETPRHAPAEPEVGGVSAVATQDWPPGGRGGLRGGAGPGWQALSTPLHVQGACSPTQALLQALGFPQITPISRPPPGGSALTLCPLKQPLGDWSGE